MNIKNIAIIGAGIALLSGWAGKLGGATTPQTNTTTAPPNSVIAQKEQRTEWKMPDLASYAKPAGNYKTPAGVHKIEDVDYGWQKHTATSGEQYYTFSRGGLYQSRKDAPTYNPLKRIDKNAEARERRAAGQKWTKKEGKWGWE